MLQSVLKSDSRFGVVRWDPIAKKMADVGCCAEVIKHQTTQDGRSNIVTIGQQRFRILEIINETPFINALVSWVDDDKINDHSKLENLKDSVANALKDVVSLTSKLTDSEHTLPESLPNIPRELSFWIAAHLGGPVATEQQNLLELTNTYHRLEREYELLDQTRRELAARTALKDTFSNADQANN